MKCQSLKRDKKLQIIFQNNHIALRLDQNYMNMVVSFFQFQLYYCLNSLQFLYFKTDSPPPIFLYLDKFFFWLQSFSTFTSVIEILFFKLKKHFNWGNFYLTAFLSGFLLFYSEN